MVKKWLLRSGFAALVIGGFVLAGGAMADPPKDPGSNGGACGGIENALEHANSPAAIEHLCGVARDKGCSSKAIFIHCDLRKK